MLSKIRLSIIGHSFDRKRAKNIYFALIAKTPPGIIMKENLEVTLS